MAAARLRRRTFRVEHHGGLHAANHKGKNNSMKKERKNKRLKGKDGGGGPGNSLFFSPAVL